MKIGIVGAGNIGGNLATQWARRGHDVMVSYKRDPAELAALAARIGARAGSVDEAVAHGEVVVLSVPWVAVDEIAQQVDLGSTIVVDTTNQFASGGVADIPGGISAAEHNARRFPGARLVKTFNTFTSGFQTRVGDGDHDGAVAMFLGGEDAAANDVVSGLVRDAGFVPVDLGGWSTIRLIEAPRRPGSVYGEEFRPDAALRIADAAARDLAEAGRLAAELAEPG